MAHEENIENRFTRGMNTAVNQQNAGMRELAARLDAASDESTAASEQIIEDFAEEPKTPAASVVVQLDDWRRPQPSPNDPGAA